MPRPKKSVDQIEIGDLVRHPKWGEGTVLSKTGRDEGAKVVVVFPEAGQKKLMLKYARLRKVQIKRDEEQLPEEEEIEEEEEEIEEKAPAQKDDEEEDLEDEEVLEEEDEEDIEDEDEEEEEEEERDF